MNEVQSADEGISQEELFSKIVIRCPQCSAQKNLQVPTKIILQSGRTTTISIPSGIICEHYFQAFIDQNFAVRGYQIVDFNISKMEYYESKGEEEEREEDRNISSFLSLPLFQEIINLLRYVVDDYEIIGSAILTVDGKVLYSSIPHSALFNTIKEFEVRNEQEMHSILKMFLELKNHQKVCSEYTDILGTEFVLVLVFAKEVNLAIGTMYMRDLTKKIRELID
jgi:predicted regulator of Ras-like GTPase activity (Roadblock/LC7/MglB family)